MRTYYDIKQLYKKNYNIPIISGGSITNSDVGKTYSYSAPQTGLTVAGGCSGSSPCINFKYKNKNYKGGKIRLII
jgi:hypothetical protein